MPLLPILPGRFFARLRAFELACPRCGELFISGGKLKRERKLKNYRHLDYNQLTQAWRCPSCGLKLTLGIVAWRAQGQQLPSSDTGPSLDESKKLRELLQVPTPEALRGPGRPRKLIMSPPLSKLLATLESVPSVIIPESSHKKREPVNLRVEGEVETSDE